MGGYGFIKDYPAEKYYRDVKLCTIGEGNQRNSAIGDCPAAYSARQNRVDAPGPARGLHRKFYVAGRLRIGRSGWCGGGMCGALVAREFTAIENHEPDAEELPAAAIFSADG